MVSKEYFGENKEVEFKQEIPSKHEKFLKDINKKYGQQTTWSN